MRDTFALGGVTVAPGARATIDLPVSVLSDHTPVTLSVQVVHGRRPGPVVFVSSGVHGDEVIGTEIVRRLLRAPALKGLRGTLLAVPIVNAFGFLNRSRYMPDRRDLNRCFPGSAGGSLAARLAHLVLTEVVGRSAFGIDLHSAAVHRTNLPQTRVSPGAARAAAMARAFGAPVILTSPLREGSLRGAAAERGVEVLLYEAGEGLRFDEMAIRTGVAGILRVLHAEGMLSGRPVAAPRRAPVPCRASRWLRAPIGGLLRTYRAEGDEVAEGDLLAAVADPFGEVEAEIRAPAPGILVGRAVLPVVNEGDAVFHLAFPAAPEDAEGAVDALRDQIAAEPLFDEDEII